MAPHGTTATHRIAPLTELQMKSSWWLALAAASKQAGMRPLLLSLLRKRPTLVAVPSVPVWDACLHPDAEDLVAAAAIALPDAGEAEQLREFMRAVQGRVQPSACINGVGANS